jgi:hypothetical protein
MFISRQARVPVTPAGAINANPRKAGNTMVGSLQNVLIEGPSRNKSNGTHRPHREHAQRVFFPGAHPARWHHQATFLKRLTGARAAAIDEKLTPQGAMGACIPRIQMLVGFRLRHQLITTQNACKRWIAPARRVTLRAA